MLDLRNFSKNKGDSSSKKLQEDLDKKLKDQTDDIRSRNKTSDNSKLDNKTGSIFDFLLTVKYNEDFMTLLKLNQELVDPDNKKSKTTRLSQKKFLEMVKSMRPSDEELQDTTQSTFYKWLCRNGLGTKEQITNYYRSRSKEVANSLKRRVIIDELINDLGDRPELIVKLFSYPEFRNQIINIIKEVDNA